MAFSRAHDEKPLDFRVPLFCENPECRRLLASAGCCFLPLEFRDVLASLVGTLSAAWFASPFSYTTPGFTRVTARKTSIQLSKELF